VNFVPISIRIVFEMLIVICVFEGRVSKSSQRSGWM